MKFLRNLLAHPYTKQLDLDSPNTTALRKNILKQKPFLRKIYQEWYECINNQISKNSLTLEIGSGAGFADQIIPNLIKSEVFEVSGVDCIANACQLPFSDSSLDTIIMTDVFHHIPDVSKFLEESERCLRVGGKILMIEPWLTWWSKIVYKNLHHEPFSEYDSNWKLSGSGPLSDANGALPWIIFHRDRMKFEQEHRALKITSIVPMMPFSYLLCGGISTRNLIPAFLYKFIRLVESFFPGKYFSMFAFIEIKKLDSPRI